MAERKTTKNKKANGNGRMSLAEVRAAAAAKAAAEKAAGRRAKSKKSPAERMAAPFFKPPAKKTVRFSAADLEDFRKELLYMRGRIAAKIKSDNQASFKREDESHHAEDSTEAYERFFAIETSSSFQEIIYHIDEALNSIKEGTYGICKNCGGLIQKPRLQALPFAKNCIRCQALLERRQ